MAYIGKALRRDDGAIDDVAKLVGCEPAVIDAIIKVETQQEAFDPSSRLVVRPEAHKLAVCPLLSDADKKRAAKLKLTTQPKLVGYQYDPIKAGNSAWAWVDAVAFNFGEDAAYWCTSFGSPQIMGFNYGLCKFSSPSAMVRAFADSEHVQLMAMGEFILAAGLKDACRQRKWKVIARLYNGKNYAENAYDVKLEAAYASSAHEKSTTFIYPDDDILEMGERGNEIRALQSQLAALGFHVNADGDFGIETRDAVRAAQFRLGLTVDGKVGPDTKRALALAAPKEPPTTPVAQVIANSSTAKSALAQIAIGAVTTGIATASAVSPAPNAPVALPTLTDVDGAIKLSEQGIGLATKILAIGVDKMLIALGAGALIFGAIALYQRLQAHYQRKIG